MIHHFMTIVLIIMLLCDYAHDAIFPVLMSTACGMYAVKS